jgi:putative Mg2+ transporter-C (MgtC) family protein
MLVAALLGALVGIQRERAGKPAGVRTHMLVSMGGALFFIT